MDANVRAIQERLRKQFSTSMVPGQRFEDVPLMVFDEVAGLPTGGEAFVGNLVAQLKGRGWRVAHIVRQLTEDEGGAAADGPVADACVTVGPDRLTVSRPVPPEDALDAAIDAVREGYDIVIGQNFGFAIVPRVLLTRRVQEGFNLGLPNVVAYVSDGQLDVAIPHFTALEVERMADFVEKTLGLDAAPETIEE